jgi:hypothetical protein
MYQHPVVHKYEYIQAVNCIVLYYPVTMNIVRTRTVLHIDKACGRRQVSTLSIPKQDTT